MSSLLSPKEIHILLGQDDVGEAAQDEPDKKPRKRFLGRYFLRRVQRPVLDEPDTLTR